MSTDSKWSRYLPPVCRVFHDGRSGARPGQAGRLSDGKRPKEEGLGRLDRVVEEVVEPGGQRAPGRPERPATS
ncbi:hypothetical protein ACFQ60_46765 [Streptomyces zhihengii]